MTIYDRFKSGEFNDYKDKGFLKPIIVPSCKAYALFLSYRADRKGYEEAVELTAEACSVSTKTVKRAIALAQRERLNEV